MDVESSINEATTNRIAATTSPEDEAKRMMVAVHTVPGPGFTKYARWLGRCPCCKAIVKIEYPSNQPPADASWALMWRRHGYCATCNRPVLIKMVSGVQSDRKCGSLCRNAKGPDCECSCAGANHGGG